MNGRVYDPFLAMFTSSDPTIPDEWNGQSFNRFAYVLGNPLRYWDPSGFDPRDRVTRPSYVIRFPCNPSIHASCRADGAGGGGAGDRERGARFDTSNASESTHLGTAVVEGRCDDLCRSLRAFGTMDAYNFYYGEGVFGPLPNHHVLGDSLRDQRRNADRSDDNSGAPSGGPAGPGNALLNSLSVVSELDIAPGCMAYAGVGAIALTGLAVAAIHVPHGRLVATGTSGIDAVLGSEVTLFVAEVGDLWIVAAHGAAFGLATGAALGCGN